MHASFAIPVFSHLASSFISHPCSCLSRVHLSRNEAEGLCLYCATHSNASCCYLCLVSCQASRSMANPCDIVQ